MLKIMALSVLGVTALSACGAIMGAAGKTCVGELYTQQEAKLAARSTATIGKAISFCKGGRSPQIVTVTMPDTSIWPDSVLAMNTLHEINNKGEIRYDGSCNDNGRKKYASELVPVALTSQSFGQFKLCYFDPQKATIALSLVSENEPCPAGSVAQDRPVDDCSQLVP